MAISLRCLTSLSRRPRLPTSTPIQSSFLVKGDKLACSDSPTKPKCASWVRTRAFSSCSIKASKRAFSSCPIKELDEIDKERKNKTLSSSISDATKQSVITATTDVNDTTQATDNTDVTDANRVASATYMESLSDLDEDELTEAEASKLIDNLTEEEKYRLGKYKLFWLQNPAYISMPNEMTNRNWLKLLKLRSMKQIRYYFGKLEKEERRKERRKEKEINEQNRKIEKEQVDEAKNIHDIFDGPFLNQYHNRHQAKLSQLHKIRGCQSIMFGRPLVFDCVSEDHYHDKRSCFLTNIMSDLYQANIAHIEPFHFNVAGVCKKGHFEKRLTGRNLFIDVHTKDICDIFPREKLVYLTPFSRNPLTFHAEDVLVFGAMTFYSADHTLGKLPLTAQRAEELGVRTAFLPVNRFIRHTLQNKHQFPALPVLRALLDYNYTRGWGTALKHMEAMLTDKERIKQKIWLEMKETEEKRKKATIS